jgi:PhnB protein
MSARRPRDGHGTVTPRIVVDDISAQTAFLRSAFGATADVEPGRPTEVHLGDSLIMVSSNSERDVFPGFFYIYVDDADQTYERALSAGAFSIEAPLNTPYGDRRAMVRDPFGNVFQIAHEL